MKRQRRDKEGTVGQVGDKEGTVGQVGDKEGTVGQGRDCGTGKGLWDREGTRDGQEGDREG